jgi:ubiquinone/menaquinone biosynthesis C-methylase UbiE
MSAYYSQWELRAQYQTMLNAIPEASDTNPVVKKIVHQVRTAYKGSFLEVGCGSGRMYASFAKSIADFDYTGIEMSDEVITANKMMYPAANWFSGSVYELPFADNRFTTVFSNYVIEHLVFPEAGIREMLRVLQPGGQLYLVFPDFSISKRFPSQELGLGGGEETAKEKLRKGLVLNALMSLYDSRFRLPAALRLVSSGADFMINLSPRCLKYPELVYADIDAVYIASKQQIQNWCIQQNLKCDFPAGVSGEFAFHAFMVIYKD